jgi:hypothetical protein
MSSGNSDDRDTTSLNRNGSLFTRADECATPISASPRVINQTIHLDSVVRCVVRLVTRHTARIYLSDADHAREFNALRASNVSGIVRFYSEIPSRISFDDYVTRIAAYTGASDECFILALVYIDRFITQYPTFRLNHFSHHRTFLAALLVAIKFQDDVYISNTTLAKIGGIPLAELNALELTFVSGIDYNCHVDSAEYRRYLGGLIGIT